MSFSVKKAIDQILSLLLEKLRSEGFVKGGNLTLIRAAPESVFSLDFQLDKYNTKSEGKFGVNLSFWYPAVARERDEDCETPRTHGGLHLTKRLPMLAGPAPDRKRVEDKWWEVNESTDQGSIVDAIYALWDQVGRRWMLENDTLQSAVAQLAKESSEFHQATALYAAGEVDEARRVAQSIWNGTGLGWPERIEWAWRRKLFDLDDLRHLLSHEDYHKRINALDRLWHLGRFAPETLSSVDEIARNATTDSDTPVAQWAGKLVESIYMREGKLQIVPLDVPALKKLPRLAVVAFACRCARRVEQRIPQSWPDVNESRIATLAAVLKTIEDIAAGICARTEARHAEKRAIQIARAATTTAKKNPSVKHAQKAIQAICMAALSPSGGDGATAAEVAARNSTHAVEEHQALDVRKAIWEDFDFLTELARKENWNDKTPVPKERFPAMELH